MALSRTDIVASLSSNSCSRIIRIKRLYCSSISSGLFAPYFFLFSLTVSIQRTKASRQENISFMLCVNIPLAREGSR